MNMTLSYNDNCPEGWQPAGFRPGDEETSKMLARDGFDDNFTMETGFHKYVFQPSSGHLLITTGFL